MGHFLQDCTQEKHEMDFVSKNGMVLQIWLILREINAWKRFPRYSLKVNRLEAEDDGQYFGCILSEISLFCILR